jgi:hypothetical protein
MWPSMSLPPFHNDLPLKKKKTCFCGVVGSLAHAHAFAHTHVCVHTRICMEPSVGKRFRYKDVSAAGQRQNAASSFNRASPHPSLFCCRACCSCWQDHSQPRMALLTMAAVQGRGWEAEVWAVVRLAYERLRKLPTAGQTAECSDAYKKKSPIRS